MASAACPGSSGPRCPRLQRAGQPCGVRGVRGLHRLSATRLSLRLLSIPFQIGSKSGRGVDAGQDLGGSLLRTADSSGCPTLIVGWRRVFWLASERLHPGCAHGVRGVFLGPARAVQSVPRWRRLLNPCVQGRFDVRVAAVHLVCSLGLANSAWHFVL